MAKRLFWGALALLTVIVAAPALAQDTMSSVTGVVNVGGNAELGAFLVDANGMTLYVFANDTASASACTGQCLDNWPALTVESAAELTAGAGVAGRLGAIQREDTGALLQVTYNHMPLYRWVNDAAPGDATGHNFRDVWFVARPQTLALGGSAELGAFLVDANGMTLYTFANDEAGVSNCTDQCLDNWPALTVASADELNAGLGGVPADTLGVFERADTGALQVTYMGMPLYRWVNDAAPGDATGHNFRDVWFVVQPPIVSVRASAELGDHLVGSDGMTLYTFANDEPGASACTGGCAANWPPLVVPGAAALAQVGEGIMGALDLIEREDGTLQVTYNDMPLYFWTRDSQPGDTNGHNFREVWSAAAP